MCNDKSKIVAVVIDDDQSHRFLLQTSLTTAYEPSEIVVMEFDCANEALANLPTDHRVVIFCDYQLGGASGIDWLPDFLRANIGPVILVTSSEDPEIAFEAFRHGATDFAYKGTIFQNPNELRKLVGNSLRKYQLNQANAELSRKLEMSNRELVQKNTTLAQMTDTAHRFVDDVAHEFRTPLAVIKEFASIIADGIGGEVTDLQSEYLGYINDASTDLASLIDDFLDSSKLRARSLRVTRCEHSVEDLFDAAWPMIQTRAKSKSIILKLQIQDDLPTVYADADKVKRSLINLVVNAIKFSGTDQVVTLAAQLDGPGKIRLSVIDEGTGLPQDAAERLFDRFKQSANADHIDSKGFGLGLNIVKEMVMINLGTVGVESECGKGSTFSFTIPTFETTSIVDSMLECVAARNSFGTLSVLKVSMVKGENLLIHLMKFLSSSCYPTDLVLPSSDGQSCYVIGETTEPDPWRNKILSLYSKKNDQASPNALEVSLLGMWPLDEAREAIIGLLTPIMEVKRCA